jgi:hypothetical protein
VPDERTFGVTFGEILANFGETPNVPPSVRRKIDVWGDIWGTFVCSVGIFLAESYVYLISCGGNWRVVEGG